MPNDKDSVQVYLKKMTDILTEMEMVNKKVETLKVSSQKMVDRSHYDENNIK